MLTNISNYITIVAVIGVVSITYFGYRHYVGMQDTIAGQRAAITKLEENASKLSSVINTQDRTITEIQNFYKQDRIRMRQLQENLERAETDLEELQRLFRDHDLTNLAAEKPELIERRINEATQDVFDAIERDTAR